MIRQLSTGSKHPVVRKAKERKDKKGKDNLKAKAKGKANAGPAVLVDGEDYENEATVAPALRIVSLAACCVPYRVVPRGGCTGSNTTVRIAMPNIQVSKCQLE